MPDPDDFGVYKADSSRIIQNDYDEDLPMSYNLPAGQIMGESLSAYYNSFFKYSLLSLLAVLPLGIWGFLLFRDVDMYQLSELDNIAYQLSAIRVLSLFLQSMAVGAIVYGVFRQKSSQNASFGRCLGVALSKLHKLIGVTLVIILGAVFVALPIMLGAFIPIIGILIVIAAIVPLLMFITATYLAPAVVVVESRGVLESIKRSFDLTRGNRMKIFGILVVFGVANKAIDYVLNTFSDSGSFSQSMTSVLENAEISMWINLIVTVFFSALGAVAVAQVYHRIRSKREGLSDVDLASLFD